MRISYVPFTLVIRLINCWDFIQIWYDNKMLSSQWDNNNQHFVYIIVSWYLLGIITCQGFLFSCSCMNRCTCIYVIWTILRGSLWFFFSRAYLTLRQIFLGNTSQHRARVYCSFLQNGWHPFFIHYIYGPALAEFYRLRGHSSASKIFPKILIFLVIYGQLMVAWYFHVKWLLTVVKEWREYWTLTK